MKLSVVVPFFRAASFVPAAVDNLARQAHPDVEFVLVEDGSGDDTLDTLERECTRLPGARIVPRAENGGLAAARNTGIDESQGRYLTFLDADDWYAPGYLSELIESIEYFGCEFVRVDHVQVSGRTRRIVRSAEGRRNEVFAPIESVLPSKRSSGIDYPYAWAGIFDLEEMDRSLLHFDAGLHTCEDRPWLWRIYLTARSHAVVGLQGIFYRREVSGSLTQIGDERQLHFLDAFALIFDDLARRGADVRHRHKATRTFCAISAHHLKLDARCSPDLRESLHRRVSTALHEIDQAELHDVFAAMADERAVRLQRVMRQYGP